MSGYISKSKADEAGLPELPIGKLLAKNTLFNLTGNILPMIVAVITIPIIIDAIGVDRFGILTLAWMVIGYFSLFDMGLGRATTKFVSDYLTRNETSNLTRLIWTSLIMLFGFGLIGTIIALFLAEWLVVSVLNVDPALQDETIKVFYILAFSVPILTGTAGSRGILEAYQRFDLINYIKVPTYITAFVTPLFVLPFSQSLVPIVTLLVISRFLGLVAFLIGIGKNIPGLLKFKAPDLAMLRKLLGYGGWLTISGLIWPILTYLDRFIIGAVLTMSAVAYYTTPYELITKLLIISGSFLGVLFPAFCSYAVDNHLKLVALHNRGVKYLLLIMVPIVFSIICLAKPFFDIWLGIEFAENSTFILQALALGILINSVSQVTSNAILAIGRPDITAKLHLIELPLYLMMVLFLISQFGIKGAAVAWVIRVIFDSTLLFLLYRRIVPVERKDFVYPKANLLIGSLLLIGLSLPISLIDALPLKIALIVPILIAAIFYAWKYQLDLAEKEYFGGIIRRFSKWSKR